MNQNARSKIAIALGGLFVVFASGFAHAAPQPDAGNLLDSVREKDFAQPKKSVPGIDVQQEERPGMKRADGFSTRVSAFHVTGATVFTEAELQAKVAPWVGKDLTLADMEKAAAEISRFYRGKGYLVARAYLPAQEISNGVVEIAVLEGRIGKVDVRLSGKGRLDELAVKNMVDGSIAPGDVVSEKKLERGLLLANDMAGVNVNSTLVPGASVGTSDLVVEAEQAGMVNGEIDYDNFGNRYTGDSRIGASLNINNPAKRGDLATVRVMTSGSGLYYGRLSYMLPVGSKGTKIGAAYSEMHYKLGKEFSPLDVKGNAKVASLFALHPFVRSRNFSLYGSLGYDHKSMLNKAGPGTTSDNRDNLISLGVSGDSRDGLGGGGMNSFSATYFGGKLDLSAWQANKLWDESGPQTDGRFHKIDYSLARIQHLGRGYTFYAAFTGQAASRNLDSSEKFILGGPTGVRAYPQGEASSDEGELLNLEVRKDMGEFKYGSLQLVGFLDTGHAHLHKNTWTNWQGTNPNLANSYSLTGAGVGLNLDKGKSYSVKAFLATKIGSNAGRDASGNDSDSTDRKSRFWLQAVKWF
jgi:hemolysin activation/secretion protein